MARKIKKIGKYHVEFKEIPFSRILHIDADKECQTIDIGSFDEYCHTHKQNASLCHLLVAPR